jgi:hypothetical protein
MRARYYVLFAMLLGVVGEAEASRVVLMVDPPSAGELHSALQVTLAGVTIADLPPPEGTLRLDRAAFVQRAAIGAGADAGVWIERDGDMVEVCAVSADGRAFRHAPLPNEPDGGSPRVFAAIVTSLLDEMLAPPEAGIPPITVNVQVDVGAESAPPAPEIFAPGIAIAEPAVAESGEPIRARSTLVEVGPMLSPVSAGLEAEVTFAVGSRLRVGAMGFANMLLVDDHSPLFGGALEVRRVGLGRRHFDVGVLGGAATAESDPVLFLALRLNVVWERAASGLGVSLAPALFFAPVSGGGTTVGPGAWASVRWALPV